MFIFICLFLLQITHRLVNQNAFGKVVCRQKKKKNRPHQNLKPFFTELEI